MSTQVREPASLPNGVTRGQIAAAITSRVQQLIILPTEKCNFRCTYCYEDFELGKMSKTLQRAIELFLERRIPELEALDLSWFGGEPLLAKDVMLRLARFANDLCIRHDTGLVGSTTTNGYLLNRDLATQLMDLRQGFFQITLDGWNDGHDQTRRRADGAGTFKVIWDNLLAIQLLARQDFRIALRIHMTWGNVDSVRHLVRRLVEQFGQDPRYSLDFQHIRDLGGAGGANIKRGMTWAEAHEVEKELEEVWFSARRSLGGVAEGNDAPKQVHGGATAETTGPPYICYASKPNSLLIRANGRLGKCTVAFSDPRNDLGYLGDDGEVVINNAKLQPWIRGLGSLESSELGCPLVNMERSSMESPQRRVIPIHAEA